MAGSIQKVNNNTFRLHYMYKGNRYSETIKLDNVKKDFKKDKQLQLALSNFINSVDKGSFYNTNYTFFEFSQIWLDNVIRPNSSISAVNKYKMYLNNRILPYIGIYKLNEINVLILNSFFNEVKIWTTLCKHDEEKRKTCKCKTKGKPLSKGTIEKIYSIVNAILQKAFEFELMPNNPCRKIKLNLSILERNNDTVKYYNRETYKIILNLLENETLEHRVIIELALKTGLRRSEIFGLTWKDIDLKNKTISINKSRHLAPKVGYYIRQTKTKSSNRTISIPASLILILKEYKIKYNNNEYLFEQISIDGICSWFRKFQIKNNITPIRFHDLRHTHATLLLLQGIDLKTIQDRLGHSNISMTMNTYTHVLKELDINASEKIDNL